MARYVVSYRVVGLPGRTEEILDVLIFVVLLCV